ncbi:MAG: vWA domain-containing protein [Planctomycetota bacterium]
MEALFSFRHPAILSVLLVPALLLAGAWTRPGGRIVLPVDHSRAGPGTWIRVTVNLAESFPPLLLGIVILLLAGPQRWDEPRSKRVLTNIEFCVDVSGSMGSSFGGGTRYDASMEAINEFLDYREGDAFGLTFFGNQVLHWVPLTTDVSAFRCAPPFMRPGQLPWWFNGTEIGKALLACRKVLVGREEGDRMILLISDGYSADLGGGRDLEIARELRADGVVVYAVHIATGRAPEPIVNITSLTGGEIFQPGDVEGLRRVFQRIDEMQETRLEKSTAEAVDHYGPLATSALIVLAVLLLVAFGLRTTPW